MESELIKAYREIFMDTSNRPNWAVHKITPGHESELIHPPIPFVGKEYCKQTKRILLYASAENLSKYAGSNGYLDDDEYAINRHRNTYNESVSKGLFFPNVHIQPINDGVLPIITLYLYLRYNDIDDITPSDFLERISFANYCKFTVQSEKNKDYAGVADKVMQSRDYVKRDLSILKPDIIIIPKTIYHTDKEFINGNKGNAVILPILQMNVRNVNIRIKKYPKTPETELNRIIAEWYNNLNGNGFTGVTRKNFISVFKYMDECIKEAGL